MENVYELLYMCHMQDEYAQKALLDYYGVLKSILINKVIRSYSYLNLDREDLQQEMAVAIMNAVDAYREDQNCGFDTFVTHCIMNRFMVIVKACLADKRKINIGCLSLDSEYLTRSEPSKKAIDLAVKSDSHYNPEFSFYYKESLNKFKECINSFEPQDREIMNIYIQDEVQAYLKDKSEEERRLFINRLASLKRKCKKALYGRK
ncbi:MAG: sigma-70 family RNA polymerase sigma factor [Erysipelotrichaceae bacterium]|nr:sigma-70 family RNA polymerase sigma factor [Erysipelotrichaceae bacterium]